MYPKRIFTIISMSIIMLALLVGGIVNAQIITPGAVIAAGQDGSTTLRILLLLGSTLLAAGGMAYMFRTTKPRNSFRYQR